MKNVRILSGRKKITTDVHRESLLDTQVLCDVLNIAMGVHLQNKLDIDYLIDFHKGFQPILYKEKDIREEINNKLVVNHAQMITRKIVGYFLGNPIQYIASGYRDKKELIDELNVYTQYENKASVDNEIGEYQSITGTAYRIIFRDSDSDYEDEVPFEDRSLDPSTTFVVYESDITGKPLMGVTFYEAYDSKNQHTGRRIYVYTDYGRYEFLVKNDEKANPQHLIEFQRYDVSGVPIIEYPNNMWRIGDWELMTGLMNSINALNSGRLDDVDQIVQSLLVFVNAEIDRDAYDEMRKKGVVMLKNSENNKSQVESIINSLDQQGMHLLAKDLEELLYILVGVPSRNNGRTSGDTGLAVELRDGWADLETIAKKKELVFRESEKQALKIILHIFNIGRTEQLSRLDLDIKFSRNKNNNMLVKTQSYQSLLSTKTVTPEDGLSIVDLVSDSKDYIDRGQAFWGENFAKKLEGLQKSNENDEKQLSFRDIETISQKGE